MVVIYRSTKTDPFQRGLEFSQIHSTQIKANIAAYQAIFAARSAIPFDVLLAGEQALAATLVFAPPLHEEMLGLAQGAGVAPALIGMLNARTEILACIGAVMKGECSAVVFVPETNQPPIAIQTWDWYYSLRHGWLVWEIPHTDGTITKTMTEYGIVGKAGLNTRGLGLLFTILHHKNDGQKIGVPVHVVARWILDRSKNIANAAALLASANVSASSSINLVSSEQGVPAAITVELFPGGPGFVLPDNDGYILHTNHFLAAKAREGDTEPKLNPDTLLRLAYLQRRLRVLKNPQPAEILKVMESHSGGEGAVCCHHDPAAAPDAQYETLATIVLNVATGDCAVSKGGPCQT